MVKRLFLIGSLVMLLTACLTLGTSHVAFAQSTRAANCSITALSNTTMNAQGSTSAHVSTTVWHDNCDGLYFASANSFTDGNGFAFHGTVYIYDTTQGSYNARECDYAGICETPELNIFSNDIFYIEYVNNNGVFYSCSHYESCNHNTIEGWDYIQ